MATPRYAARPQSFQYPPGQPTRFSSRSSYPTFLSIQESALLQLTWAWRGLYDSFRWNIVISTVSSDAEIRANVYKSLLLNSLSLLSIYVFDLLLQPLVKDQQKWFHRNIGWFYQILWLLPVVGVSLYLNGTWCSIIGKRIYLLQHGGRPVASQTTSYTGMLKAIATSAYRVVMICTSVVVSFALGRVPLVGPTAAFVFMCWVDSYYCFEFVWISRGLSLSRRIRHLEERWAYYFAFGLPSAAVCIWGSTLANAAIFALIFPSYIIMAMHARPVPADPYNPLPPPTPIPSSSHEETDTGIRHPSPFIPIRLPIFAVVIGINDAIVRVLNFIGGRPIVRHAHSSNPSIGGGSGPGLGPSGRRRALSDSAESAEDGQGGMRGAESMVDTLVFGGSGNSKGASVRGSPSPAPSASGPEGAGKPIRAASGRVNIGTRKKLD